MHLAAIVLIQLIFCLVSGPGVERDQLGNSSVEVTRRKKRSVPVEGAEGGGGAHKKRQWAMVFSLFLQWTETWRSGVYPAGRENIILQAYVNCNSILNHQRKSEIASLGLHVRYRTSTAY